MAIITEDYVSFEIAKLLKEKGFDEHCFCINYPLPEEEHHNIILSNLLNNSMIPFTNEYKFCRYKEDFITIPTFQMAMKWLRDVHKVNIEIHYNRFGENYKYLIIYKPEVLDDIRSLGVFYSYEETVEAAIRYCLENLI